MGNRTRDLLKEWAEEVVNGIHKTGFYGINIIEKILRDPGISTGRSRHRVLWWPKNKRIAKVSRAMHQIDNISEACLVVKHGRPIKEDGTRFTKYDLAKNSSVTVRRFNELTKKAETKLSELLGTYK